jgi:hypothetical protein
MHKIRILPYTPEREVSHWLRVSTIRRKRIIISSVVSKESSMQDIIDNNP